MSGKGQSRSTSFTEATNALRRAQRAIEKVAAQGDLIFPPESQDSNITPVQQTTSHIPNITIKTVQPTQLEKPDNTLFSTNQQSTSQVPNNSNSTAQQNRSQIPGHFISAPLPTAMRRPAPLLIPDAINLFIPPVRPVATEPPAPPILQPLATHSVTRSLEQLSVLSPTVYQYVASKHPATYQQFLKSTLDAYLVCRQRTSNGNYEPLPSVTFFNSSPAQPVVAIAAPSVTQVPTAFTPAPVITTSLPATYPNTVHPVSQEAYLNIPYFQNIGEMQSYLWEEIEKVKSGSRISFRRPYAVLATNCRLLDISLADVRAQHGFSLLHFMVYYRYTPAVEILINATDKYTHIARNVSHESGNTLLHFCGLFAQPDQDYWNTQLNEENRPVNATLIDIVKLLSDTRFADHVCLDVNETFYRHPDGSTHAHRAAMSGALDMLCFFHHHSTVSAFTVPRSTEDKLRPVDLAEEHKHHHITQHWHNAQQRVQVPVNQVERHKRPHEGSDQDNRRVAFTSDAQGQQNIPQFIPIASPTPPETNQNTYLVGSSSLPLSPSFYNLSSPTQGTSQEDDSLANLFRMPSSPGK